MEGSAFAGAVVRPATGPDNEEMERVFADLRGWQGAAVFLWLVDAATDGWGRLNFDDVFLDDAPRPRAREFRPGAPN